eukprot:COSAG06_NODE_4845_length_3911_cov_2.956978_2_plen_85_part_00
MSLARVNFVALQALGLENLGAGFLRALWQVNGWTGSQRDYSRRLIGLICRGAVPITCIARFRVDVCLADCHLCLKLCLTCHWGR